ncbi:hypothetical protein TNCV_4943391 [Trichonephila clavipes]|nr:hypothetical protein TNCV_4943391 [Trichonephila clavipes]
MARGAQVHKQMFRSGGQSDTKPPVFSSQAMQHAFRRHFEIPPRGRVPSRKCLLIRMDTFRATGNVPKEREIPLKTIRTPENVEQVHVSIQTVMWQFFLTVLQEKDIDNVWLQQDRATVHNSNVSIDVLRASFPE